MTREEFDNLEWSFSDHSKYWNVHTTTLQCDTIPELFQMTIYKIRCEGTNKKDKCICIYNDDTYIYNDKTYYTIESLLEVL